MFYNVKTKFVFLLKGMNVVMSAIYFKVQVASNLNMIKIFLDFKWGYIKKINLDRSVIDIIQPFQIFLQQ